MDKVITDVREYPWVSNVAKVFRAEKDLKAQKLPVTEEALKALYIKYGGLCIGEPETQRGVEEGEVAFAVLTPEQKEEVQEKASKKKSKK